jgi:1-acyl-sn-glycerol-3-phosphate acyltransferase
MTRLVVMVRDYATHYMSLVVFATICLTWSVLSLPLYILLPRRTGATIGRLGISRAARIYAYWLIFLRAYRLDLGAIDALRGGPAVILAPNHPSMIDAVLILARHPNVACVMKSNLMNNVLLGSFARLAGYIRNHPPRRMVLDCVEELRQGGVLLLFPEGTRTVEPPVNSFIASIGLVAKRATVPVQALIIETDSPSLSKGWSVFRPPAYPITYRVRLGKRFDPPDDVRAFNQALEAYFRHELAESPQNCWLNKRHAPPQAG